MRKQLFALLAILLVLAGCANTSGGMMSDISPNSVDKSNANLDLEAPQVEINIEGLISGEITSGTGLAGIESILLQKKADSSDIDGIAADVDEANPDATAVEVTFDSSSDEMNEKIEAVKASLVQAFKDKLYGAGVETITTGQISVTVSSTFDSAKAVIAGLTERSGFFFDGPDPIIEIDLLGNFTGYINLTALTSNAVEEADGLAGINAGWLISDEVYEVSFTGADVFETTKQLDALKAMVEKSFLPALTEMNIKTNFGAKSPTVIPRDNKALIVLELNAPDGLSFKTDTNVGNKTELVTIEFTNEYGAFTGTLKKIDQSQVSIANLKPEVKDAMVIGSAGWAISGGSTPGATRKVAVGEESSVSAQTVVDSIAAKLNTVAANSMYEYAGVGSYTKDEATNRVVFPVTFEKKDGYLFYTGKPTHNIDFGYDFSVGALTVNDEDFADTLEALSDPDNIKALAGSSGEVTLEITENITNEKDSNGNAVPFTVDGGDEKLNLTLKATEGKEVAVNGGDILTSLIVSGKETTVTLSEGVTINGGLAEAGGGVIVKDGSHFILDGGTITGNVSTIADWTKGGGAVSVLHGKFTMNSGSITGNAALRGAGVFVSSLSGSVPSAFIMNGGSIDNNTTVIGAVTASGGGKATGGGTGVFVYGAGASFTMNGGTIQNNAASRMGSAITISTSGTLTINDGLITGNIGPYGVIGTAGTQPTLNLLGGEIKDNVYGPLNEDGTPNTALIASTDSGPTIIRAWVSDIPYGIVLNYQGVIAKLNYPSNGTYIEGAAPIAEGQ